MKWKFKFKMIVFLNNHIKSIIFIIPKSLLIYKNDKLDLCKTIAIINLRLKIPSPMTARWRAMTWQARHCMTNYGMTI